MSWRVGVDTDGLGRLFNVGVLKDVLRLKSGGVGRFPKRSGDRRSVVADPEADVNRFNWPTGETLLGDAHGGLVGFGVSTTLMNSVTVK